MEYTEELLLFEKKFALEEMTIVALMSSNGWSSTKKEEETYLTASFEISIWKPVGKEISNQPLRVLRKVDDKLLHMLKKSTPAYSIVRLRVRKNLVDDTFLLIGNPQKTEDEELAAIRDDLLKPDEYVDPILGTLVFDEGMGWYEQKREWNGELIELTIDNGEEEVLQREAGIAAAIIEDMDAWIQACCQQAAEELLEVKNTEYLAVEEGEEPVTEEEFIANLILECIQVFDDGDFAFWFDAGSLFNGRLILAWGSLKEGLKAIEVL